MEPVTVVVGALAAGAAAGLTATTAKAVADAYESLKFLVVQRFLQAGMSEDTGRELVGRAAEGPAERRVLEQHLAEVDVDESTIEAAQELLDQLNEWSGKFEVDASQAQGLQVGDHNTQHNIFN